MSNILIPVDGSPSALEAVKQVVQDRKPHDVSMHVHLINVQPRLPKYITRFADSRDVRSYQMERAEKALEDAISLLEKAGLPYSAHTRKGNIANEIVACSKAMHCRKIVMGTARKNALIRLFEGSIINRVIARADVPVEVIAKEPPTLLERFGIPVSLGAGLMLLWAVAE